MATVIFKGFASAFFVILLTIQANAQTLARPVAVVNDSIITQYDLDNRIALAIASSGLPNNPQTRQKTQKQVMQSLINEVLQLQEARKVGINIGPTDVDATIARIAKQNGTDLKTFLQQMRTAGVGASTLRQQIRAQMSWVQLVGRRLGSQVQVTDEEVSRNVLRLQQNKGRTERRLAEIFLPSDQNGSFEAANQTIQVILQELRNRKSFGAIAQQFSQSSTAASGGDLGWVMEGQLASEIERALTGSQKGFVSNPIKTPNGLYIYAVRGTRQIGVGSTVELAAVKQLVIPIAGDIKSAAGQQALAQAYGVSESVRSCAEFDNAMATLGGPGTEDRGLVEMSSFPAELAQLLRSQPIGKPTPPIPAPNGAAVLIVCDRQTRTENTAIEPGKIKRQLQEERLSVLAQRFLRDLRRQAYIDLRI